MLDKLTTVKSMLALEKQIKDSMTRSYTDDEFIQAISSPQFSRWVKEHGGNKSDSLAEHLQFLHSSQHVRVNIAQALQESKYSTRPPIHYWDELGPTTIDICDGKRYLFSLYLKPFKGLLKIGTAKIPAFFLTSNLSSNTFLPDSEKLILVPGLWKQSFLCPRSFKTREARLTVLYLCAGFTPQRIHTYLVNQDSLESLAGTHTLIKNYDIITTAINLLLYRLAYRLAKSEVSVHNMDNSSIDKTSNKRPQSLTFLQTPKLEIERTRFSPKEHVRREHVRHYKNGKEVTIKSTIVNKGQEETNYFK